MAVWLFLSLCVTLAVAGPVTFHNGVYDGFVVSIGDDVPAMDCSAILSNLEVSPVTFTPTFTLGDTPPGTAPQ